MENDYNIPEFPTLSTSFQAIWKFGSELDFQANKVEYSQLGNCPNLEIVSRLPKVGNSGILLAVDDMESMLDHRSRSAYRPIYYIIQIISMH